jgi:DNA-binding XRE family transcriptional regulator
METDAVGVSVGAVGLDEKGRSDPELRLKLEQRFSCVLQSI